MKSIAWMIAGLLLTACASSSHIKSDDVQQQVERELKQAAQGRVEPASPEAVNQALLPPLAVEMPQAAAKPLEQRFDLAVNGAPASQVFMALGSGTRYSMLVHPDIKENISLDLKNVTLFEALDAIREIYGYDYKVDGTRIYIQPVTIQTRIFQLNYLAGRRFGSADVRVTSGSIQAQTAASATGGAVAPPPVAGVATPGTSGQAGAGSEVTTSSDNNLWGDIGDAIRSIIGSGQGRNVVVNPQAGIILVQALPVELRSVEQYLKAVAGVIERQVMLEAKIIEVDLSNEFSSGINWAAFKSGANSRLGAGVANPSTTLFPDGSLSTLTSRGPDGTLLQSSSLEIDPTAATRSVAVGSGVPSSIFGLAFQTSNFAALLDFLGSQGTVHVLSSPRIATLNNQKAVLKVGTDEFFVTNISTTTTSSGASTTVSPTITVQPFFSGIALDVTPQISDDGQITLHVHPSVSLVVDKTKTLNLGTLGSVTLPLASSNIDESDTIVRVRDGTIAAIGGLMKQQQINNHSGIPGASDVPVIGNLFGSRDQQLSKSELVILLKTTIIKGDSSWQQQAQEVNERVLNMQRPAADGSAGSK